MYKFLFAFLVLIAAAQAQDVARMHEALVAHAERNGFMGTVLVAKDGKVVFAESYGSANLEWQVKNTATTKFRIGSLTKQFTATAILLLAERGKLKLEDPISKYAPGIPAAWKDITIFELLHHTSGLPNLTDFPEYALWKVSPADTATAVGRIRDKPLLFTPGSKFSYSNPGYILLGWIVELVSGEEYTTFVQKNIFTPLGMKDSGAFPYSEITPQRAAGYQKTPKGFINAPYVDMSVMGGANGLYSTAPDLLLWTQALFGGKILSADSLNMMTTPGQGDYGLGLIITQLVGRKAIVHVGTARGFNAQLSYLPESKVTVIVLANVEASAPTQLAGQLTEIEFGEKITLLSERKSIVVAPAVLSTYVGHYRVAPNLELVITLEGSQLMFQPAGQKKAPIFPETETSFFLKIVDAQVEFVKDATGAVTGLVLRQGGRDIKAQRLPETASVNETKGK